jgi:hypothetical protein
MTVSLSSLVSMLCPCCNIYYLFHEFDDYLVVPYAWGIVIIGWTESSTDTAQHSEIYVRRIRNVAMLTESYKRVHVEPSDVSISLSTCSATSEWVSAC